ncbi:MAG: stage V sporulation protein AB [Lachnospiraceae bacterium]|nr:stage V sporulation protein AB [Lachnospiraceae bacterium]
MMWIRYLLLCILGFGAGVIIAGAFIAFISTIGIFPRFAAQTHTTKYLKIYENFILLGSTLGNLVSIYSIPVPLGKIGLALVGFFSGVFIGSLVSALAEVANTIPVFSRRASLRKGLPYVLISVALGKGIGSFVQYFIM